MAIGRSLDANRAELIDSTLSGTPAGPPSDLLSSDEVMAIVSSMQSSDQS